MGGEATHPHAELDVLVRYSLNIEAHSWYSSDILVQFELVEDR
jgi:hypothetical protein